MHPQVIPDLLDRNFIAHARAPAIIYGNQTLSYAALAEECEARASWIAALGVGRGDRVGIHLAKSPEEVILIFAAARIGAISVNINPSLKPFQVRHIIDDAGVCLLIADRLRVRGLVSAGLADRVRLAVVGPGVPSDPRVLTFTKKLDGAGDGTKPIDLDIAALFYTSGSTGLPKGVAFTHGNVLSGARAVANYLGNNADDRILSLLPFSFDYGFSQLTTAFLSGATIVLQPTSMAAEVAKAVAVHAITGLALVPPAWIELTRYLLESGTKLPSLRYITNSGGPIPRAILEMMPKAFPGADIYLMYGLTEGFRATYLEPKLFAAKMGAIGRAIPGTEVFIIDPDKGLCGPNQHGELVQRGSLISKGYWGCPEDTAAKIKPNRFLAEHIGDEKVLHSGDIVYADEDGILWFIGRNDGLIKTSGYRISPEEIEEFVIATGIVREAVAFGVANQELGQTVSLAVVWESEPATDALARHCRTGLPSHMIPRVIYSWPGCLPRTSSGKYDRLAIAREAGGGAQVYARE
jgi:acyl-CoA synthetase (AMP-forming)/AMP-acid ligase II